jgi:hypothetical protein
MNKTYKQLRQYIYDNHNYDGSIDNFLEETAPLIGHIVHSFNSLDSQLNSTICGLINDRTDSLGATVIYKMTFASKIDLFSRLVKTMEVVYDGTLLSFKQLAEDLRKCANLRNAVIHAEWENLDGEGFT